MDEQVLNQEVDIFSMSDEEFASWEQSSSEVQPVEESTDVDSSNFESEEQEVFQEEQLDESEEEVDENTIEPIEESDELGSDNGEELSVEPTEELESDSFDYETEYKKLIGSPIKANGMDITIDSVEDAQRLIQMGLNYSKNMQDLKPARKIIAMLEQNEMLDEAKLGYAIDLLNKNPQAINKLVTESGIDKFDLDEEQGKDYKPTDYSVPEEQVALDNALKEISSTPTYARTVNVLGKEWDTASRDMIKSNPEVISIINDHMASGLFDTVNQEVEKRRMLGTLPSGMSNLQAYKFVGDSLYAQTQDQVTPQSQLQGNVQANVRPPIRKPSRETVVGRKNSASVPRSKATSVTKKMEDVFAMSDDEFNKKYHNYK